MPSIVNKRGLICNESRALFLLEYKHELSLLKKLILITEKGIGGLLPKDTWCYEGICYLFAKAIVSHAKMAYDNMLLGHFDAANMVLRALIENSASQAMVAKRDERISSLHIYGGNAEMNMQSSYILIDHSNDTLKKDKQGNYQVDLNDTTGMVRIF